MAGSTGVGRVHSACQSARARSIVARPSVTTRGSRGRSHVTSRTIAAKSPPSAHVGRVARYWVSDGAIRAFASDARRRRRRLGVSPSVATGGISASRITTARPDAVPSTDQCSGADACGSMRTMGTPQARACVTSSAAAPPAAPAPPSSPMIEQIGMAQDCAVGRQWGAVGHDHRRIAERTGVRCPAIVGPVASRHQVVQHGRTRIGTRIRHRDGRRLRADLRQHGTQRGAIALWPGDTNAQRRARAGRGEDSSHDGGRRETGTRTVLI